MAIKQPVINTFNRVKIPYDEYLGLAGTTATNRFTGESVQTSYLVAKCIEWVYKISNEYEKGNYSVKVADFDRIRYFVLAEDRNAYMVCLD